MAELSDRERDYRDKVFAEGKWITEDFLWEVLFEHEKIDEMKIVEKDVSPAVGFGNNYLSTLHRVVVRFSENGSHPKEVHLIVKQFPWVPVAQKMLRELGFFTKEMFMYERILPEMEKILREHADDPFIAPLSYKNKLENVIIMEDLKVQGYKILERTELLPLEHCILALKTLARLQVVFLVLEKRNPGISSEITCDFYTEKSRQHMEPFIHQMFPALSELLAEYPEGAKYSKTVKNFGPKGYDIMMDNMQKASKNFVQVLCHGDMWLTNIMFKEDDEGNPAHAKFVDFQCSRISSPAIDVLHLLCSSAQARVHSQSWPDMIKAYYDAFQHNLEIFGFTDKLFTLKEFQSEMRRLSPYGFFMACVMLPNVLNHTDDVIDMEAMPEDSFEIPDGCSYLNKLFKNDKSRSNIIGAISNLDRLGYLEEVEKVIEQVR